MARHPLQGSERSVAEGSTLVGNCNPAERIEVHVVLRRHAQARFDALLGKIEAGDPSVKPLPREAFAREFGAAAEDIAKVKAFAAQSGLTVVREDPAARTVVLGGTIAQFQAAFSVELQHYQHHSIGQYRGRTGSISVPDDLSGIVTAVLGLDNRPQARPHFRIRPPIHASKVPQSTSFTPLQVAALYQFPQGDGSGECVGIIELGGGYETSDLKTYFSSLGVNSPTLVAVGVDNGANEPTGDANGPDGEVTLDIELVGAIAPGHHLAGGHKPGALGQLAQLVDPVGRVRRAPARAAQRNLHQQSRRGRFGPGPLDLESAQGSDSAVRLTGRAGTTVEMACLYTI